MSSGPRIAPRFADCRTCTHFNPQRIKRQCLGCTFGQNFEEKVEEMDLERGFSTFRNRSHDD